MKRTILCLLLLALLLSCCLTVGAAELSRVIDNAGLLSGEQRQTLEATAEALADSYGLDAVVLTETTLSGIPTYRYADDYYDQNGYSEDGILLLLAMEEREWYVSTSGSCVYAFTDHGLSQLDEGMQPYLEKGDYYGVFSYYLNAIPDCMDALSRNAPVDGYGSVSDIGIHQQTVYYDSPTPPNLLFALFVGFAVALICVLVMRHSMNTQRPQHSAGDYLKTGSFWLYGQQDLFLYSNISKTRRQQNNGQRGGGSSVHRSSSGRTHGGRGGKF